MSACVGAGLYYLTYIFPFVEMEVLVGVAVAGGAVAAISEVCVGGGGCVLVKRMENCEEMM